MKHEDYSKDLKIQKCDLTFSVNVCMCLYQIQFYGLNWQEYVSVLPVRNLGCVSQKHSLSFPLPTNYGFGKRTPDHWDFEGLLDYVPQTWPNIAHWTNWNASQVVFAGASPEYLACFVWLCALKVLVGAFVARFCLYWSLGVQTFQIPVTIRSKAETGVFQFHQRLFIWPQNNQSNCPNPFHVF